MKTKYATLILLASWALAINSFADDRRSLEVRAQTIQIILAEHLTNEVYMQTVKIISHGETVAELKVTTKSSVRIEGGGQMIGPNGRIKLVSDVNGGVAVRINDPGESPIILRADEVEIVPERKPAMLFASPVLSAE